MVFCLRWLIFFHTQCTSSVYLKHRLRNNTLKLYCTCLGAATDYHGSHMGKNSELSLPACGCLPPFPLPLPPPLPPSLPPSLHHISWAQISGPCRALIYNRRIHSNTFLFQMAHIYRCTSLCMIIDVINYLVFLVTELNKLRLSATTKAQSFLSTSEVTDMNHRLL